MSRTLDRSQAPAFKTLDRFRLLDARSAQLSNGVPLYSINAGVQEVTRIDLLFEAGDWQQSKPLVASTTVNMLAEGSAQFKAADIAEKLDFVGSHVTYTAHKHTASVSLYCMTKHLDTSLRIVADLVLNPSFAPQELSTYLAKRKQQYIIDDSRVEIRSQKLFSRAIYGTAHPYGQIPLASDYDEITSDDLRQFHASNYTAGNCAVLMAGRITDEHRSLVDTLFGQQSCNVKQTAATPPPIVSSTERRIYEERPDAVQSSVRIGKAIVTKTHPDFAGLQVLNTVLGGYFGSRLMQNIREEKGYTYGIGSGLLSNRNGGYFTIVTEVGHAVRQAAIDEIYKEIRLLCTEAISDSELELVRNYIIATTLRNFDGAFASADSFKALLDYKLTIDYYYQFLHTVQSITPDQLLQLAQKYWGDGDFWEVSVG